MPAKKPTAEMLAELLREAGMLMSVFVFVDLMFSEHPPRWEIVAVGFIFGGIFIYLGVNLERKRK
jgi:hypothetical protein